MKYLKIKNKGLLDVRLVYLMGGTTKANDQYKIGQFGTGLKYTLAYMLRNNIDFKMFIDGKEVGIQTKTETIRDTDFNIIYINGEKSSITTNMGMDWKAWMIMRELWCNALDEEDPSIELVDEVAPTGGTTEYYIQCVADIAQVWEDWDKYFISKDKMIMDHEKFSIYEGGSSLRLYKNGVLVKEMKDQRAVFSYDLKTAYLNELREFNGSIAMELAHILPYFNEKTVEIFLDKIKDSYEEGLDYDWHSSKYGEGWKNALGESKIIDYKTYEKVVDRCPSIENDPVVQVPETLYKKLVSYFPSVSMVRASDKMNTFYEVYSETLMDKIDRAKDTLEDVGYFIDAELSIIIGVFGRSDVQGQINFDAKEIRISVDLEKMSDTDIMYTLVEENEHYRTGYQDETRAFQNHFIKLYVNSLLTGNKVELK